jgi:Protein of unknown function (DUF3039)
MGITNVEILTNPDTVTDAGDPIFTHIIDRGDEERSSETLVLEARINGTPLTALCGYTWVPSRDPQKYPICQKCLEVFEFAKDFRGV